ncbi:uncharacterized protein LOC134254960 isoform X1 [Saccostrea cucullata]|uniref:uncharacterized protein LOC134254960 isoform X1 n=1 Tax=Saccostrea cuccullata TaxID=36930 RepID=UPI002ED27441
MDKRLHFVFLWCFLILYFCTQIEAQTGVCKKDPLMCCPNYRRVGRKCEECWPGSFSYNCNSSCPYGRYGKFCLEKCNCSPCDKISGCTQNSSLQDENSDNVTWTVTETTMPESSQIELTVTEDADWLSVAMFVSGSAGLCFVIGFAAHRKLRKRRNERRSKSHQSDDDQNFTRPQLNPSANNTTFGEYIENIISEEPHFPSKYNNRTETLKSNKNFPDEGALKASKISKNADTYSRPTSENIYSHLNMDALPYNTLNLKVASEKESNIGMYSTSYQKVTSTDNNTHNELATKCSTQSSFPEDISSEVHEYSAPNEKDAKIQMDVLSLENNSHTAKSNMQKPKASMTGKGQMSSKRKLEQKKHMNEMSKMLENFKPKTEEQENNYSKASIIHPKRPSKKTQNKLLRYSFAPSTEISLKN